MFFLRKTRRTPRLLGAVAAVLAASVACLACGTAQAAFVSGANYGATGECISQSGLAQFGLATPSGLRLSVPPTVRVMNVRPGVNDTQKVILDVYLAHWSGSSWVWDQRNGQIVSAQAVARVNEYNQPTSSFFSLVGDAGLIQDKLLAIQSGSGYYTLFMQLRWINEQTGAQVGSDFHQILNFNASYYSGYWPYCLYG
jgi:hypothetical protein